jgi:acetate kinase
MTQPASRVLVLNSGSSSLKFKLFNLTKGALAPYVSGLLERIGDTDNSAVTIKGLEGGTLSAKMPLANHTEGLQHSFDMLRDQVSPSIGNEVQAIGHRVVHGGNLASSVLFDERTRKEVERAALFAPLHNRANLKGVVACDAFFPGRKQVFAPVAVCCDAQHCTA